MAKLITKFLLSLAGLVTHLILYILILKHIEATPAIWTVFWLGGFVSLMFIISSQLLD